MMLNFTSPEAAREERLAALEAKVKHHAALITDGAEMRRHDRNKLAESIGRNRVQVNQHIDRLGRRIDTLRTRLLWLAAVCALLVVALVAVVVAAAVAS